MARTCPKRQGGNTTGGDGSRRDVHANGAKSGDPDRIPAYLQLWHGGERWSCLLDSGCERSVVPYRMVRGINLQESTENLCTANGTKIAILGTVRVPFQLEDMTLEAEVFVTERNT